MQKNVHGTMTKICQLWRPTYLPPRAPRKTAPKGAGVAGEVAQYHGRFCFCCAHALMCGFQYKCPPKPAGDLKIFRARAREPPPRDARTTAPPPQVPQNGCFWLQMATKQAGRYQKSMVTFSRAPAYLPTCHRFHARFFACPL